MKNEQIWVADFETTLEQDYEEDGCVHVYLWHARSLDDSKEELGFDVKSFIEFCKRKDVKLVWFHNLKFDGSYILNSILNDGWMMGEKQEKDKMSYKHIITEQGQWMKLTLMFGSHVCDIQDSAKKFPGMSLEEIAIKIYGIEPKSYLDLDKRRGLDYQATEEDIERVKGDTRILRVAMADLYKQGFTAMTMASDAKRFYRAQFFAKFSSDNKAKKMWNRTYPQLTSEEDKFVRRSYRGGWVYINPSYKDKDLETITVYDVNSMFPSQMRYKPLPWGKPEIRMPRAGELYIVNFRAVFKIKEGKLPTYQNKNSVRNNDAEFIYTSNGEWMDLTMTCVDYELFKDHYDVLSEQDHVYYVFRSVCGKDGLFNDYIDYWMKEKERCSANGDKAGRATAKRFLNSLYGKTGEDPVKKSKISSVDENGVTRYETITDEGSSWYLPVATFITSYARAQIVETAEKFGDDFIYADTDSIHCLNAEKYKHLIKLDKTKLGYWDEEAVWEFGRYLAPKRYLHLHDLEHRPMEYKIVEKDGKKYKEYYGEVKLAAGSGGVKDEVTWENFHPGTKYHEKIMSRNVKGGCLLMKCDMELRM